MTAAPGFAPFEFRAAGAPHAQDDIGAGDGRRGVGGDRGAGRGIIRIRNGGFNPCTRFDRDLRPEANQFFYRLRRRSNPRFARIGFGRHGYTH